MQFLKPIQESEKSQRGINPSCYNKSEMDMTEKELRPILFTRTEWAYLLNKAEGLSQGHRYKIEHDKKED